MKNPNNARSYFFVLCFAIHILTQLHDCEARNLTNQFIWMSGNIFGRPQVNGPTEKWSPVTWTLTDSNARTTVYLFSGCTGRDEGDNSFWKYEYTSENSRNLVGGTWTLLRNYDSKFAIYGELLVGTNKTRPGNRCDAISWVGPNKSLWLYGGTGWTNTTKLNLDDIWKFENDIWTWMGGSHSGAVPVQIGYPGSRFRAATYQSSIMGSQLIPMVYIVGGQNTDWQRCQNDVWRFDPNQNIFERASANLPVSSGTFGNFGIMDACAVAIGHELYVYGGETYNGVTHYWEYLWYYNWIKGESKFIVNPKENTPPQYIGKVGYEHMNNTPGARSGHSCWYKDGGIYLFGGMTALNGFTLQNDLWFYDLKWNLWTWVSGNRDTQYSQKYRSVGDLPVPRKKAVTVESDLHGLSWIFHGIGPYYQLADSFRIIPEIICNGKLPNDPNVCAGNGQCISFDTCNCFNNTWGNFCQEFSCFGVDSTAASTCSGRGHCIYPNNCTCFNAFGGRQCDTSFCYPKNGISCNGKGKCIDAYPKENVCKCDIGWTGMACEVPILLYFLVFIVFVLAVLIGAITLIVFTFDCFRMCSNLQFRRRGNVHQGIQEIQKRKNKKNKYKIQNDSQQQELLLHEE